MPRSYFTKAVTTRLPLADAQFIDVKRRLSHGEQEDMFSQMRTAGTGWSRVRSAKVLAYLIGWSLCGEDGTPVPYSLMMPENARLDTIRSLDPDAFDVIYSALEKHEAAVQAETAETKNSPDGSAVSSETLPSVKS